jgi:hypothetical protein
MKINWEQELPYPIALFMAFILYFVIKVQSIRNMTMNWLSKNTISMMLFFEQEMEFKMHMI